VATERRRAREVPLSDVYIGPAGAERPVERKAAENVSGGNADLEALPPLLAGR